VVIALMLVGMIIGSAIATTALAWADSRAISGA
jgi:hypothetical protein